MFSESTDKSKDEMILEEYNIDNIDKETFESYRRRFKLHKGDNHEWNNLSDEEFLYMIRALDRKTDKLTLAGLLELHHQQMKDGLETYGDFLIK